MQQEVITDGRDIVSVLCSALADRIGKDRFTLWFGPAVRLRLDSDLLVVAAADQFSLDRLSKHFRTDLHACYQETLGCTAKIEFRVDATLAQQQQSASQAINHSGGAEKSGCRALSPNDNESSKTKPRRFANLNTFEVGVGNRVAFSAAQTTVERLGMITPLFLYGPTGSGKTHLLQGVWSAVRRLRKVPRIVMLSAEQFTSYFLEALHGSGLPSFRRRYRDVDLLLIDDVQFFVGKRATLVELQHTIDTLLRDGRQLVLSADRAPVELNGMGPELITRMSGGLVCGIEPPDHSTRLGIARRFSKLRGYNVPEDVLKLIASEINGDARQISGALNRLQATSDALEKPISVESAQVALADLIRSTKPAVRMTDIERVVCDLFGLEPNDLQSSRKSRTVVEPRMLAMWLARKYTRAAFSEIGHYFGRRTHSTVISAQKKVNHWMASGKPVQMGHANCLVDDAIRRAEARLRTG